MMEEEVEGEQEEEEEEEEAAGWRQRNKSPTRQCGEKNIFCPIIFRRPWNLSQVNGQNLTVVMPFCLSEV